MTIGFSYEKAAESAVLAAQLVERLVDPRADAEPAVLELRLVPVDLQESSKSLVAQARKDAMERTTSLSIDARLRKAVASNAWANCKDHQREPPVPRASERTFSAATIGCARVRLSRASRIMIVAYKSLPGARDVCGQSILPSVGLRGASHTCQIACQSTKFRLPDISLLSMTGVFLTILRFVLTVSTTCSARQRSGTMSD